MWAKQLNRLNFIYNNCHDNTIPRPFRHPILQKRGLISATLKPIQDALSRLEERISELENREKELEKILAEPEIIRDKSKYLPLLNEYGEVKEEMKIKPEHKELLKSMGVKEKDFRLFDGKFVRYEYDEKKGVRLYDPYYMTSYNEYIDADGWSSWSYEKDTFMSDILKEAKKKAEQKEKISPKPTKEEITQSLQKKFGKKINSEPQE